MSEILHAIYHNELTPLKTLSNLDNPQCAEARKITIQLRTVEETAAEALKPSIEVFADKQAEEAFYSGVRFGAQLMAELLK